MLETSARLLHLLSILQTGRDWGAEELADRLEVTTRTVRKDMSRLRDLGYQVDSMRGRGGGYWLSPGTTTPPLLLDDDEAVAIALALRIASGGTVRGMEDTSMQALAKLQQMLPARIQQRVEALDHQLEPVPGRGPHVDMDLLVLIATAGRNRQMLGFDYRTHDDTASRRLVEPHRLVNDGRRWYLFGWDTEREDWRTFRIDRVTEAKVRPGPKFPIRDVDDAADRVARGTATAMWHYRARVIAHAPAETMVRRLPPAIQIEPIDDVTCRLHVGSSSPGSLAEYIALLGVDFSIEDPDQHPELMVEIRSLSERFGRAFDQSR
jgi:predicted DNA-binding transcriptional regulator YafY